MASPQKQATRLRRSVKRRALFVDNLRTTAAAKRIIGQNDVARTLEIVADEQLTLMHADNIMAGNIERKLHATTPQTRQTIQSAQDHAIRMAAMEGRFSTDRIGALMLHVGLTPSIRPDGMDLLVVEKELGIPAPFSEEDMDPSIREQKRRNNIHVAPNMTLGKRIERAETKAFGAPRFA